MASNRDPRKDYRINRRGRKVTSSSDRSKRAKKASAPKPTSSSTRSRGRGTGSKRITQGNESVRTGISTRNTINNKSPKVTRATKDSREARKTNKAKVTQSGGSTVKKTIKADNNIRTTPTKTLKKTAQTSNNVRSGPKGRAVRKKPLTGGPRGAQGPRTAPVQGPYRKTPNIVADIPQRTNKPKAGGPPTPGVKFNPSKRVPAKPGMKGGDKGLKTLAAAAAVGALSSGALRNPVSKAKKKEAAKSIGKYNTKDKDGTVRNRKKVGPKKVGPKKVGPKKAGTEAQSFDKAFAAAKSKGYKTFTWKGKRYTTKTK